MRNWTAKMNGHDIRVTGPKLKEFRDLYISYQELSSRISDLLMFDIYVYEEEFGISPHDIISTIKNLEAGEPHSGIKPATQFRNTPLKGLWHKHFFSAHFLVQNINIANGKNGVADVVKEVMENSSSPVVTREMIREIAHRVTNDAVNQRDQSGKITGEWVIFAKNNGKNYYLCANTHNAGDQFIYDRIMAECVKDFSELPDWFE